MPSKIFVNYRRDDVPGDARGVRDGLAAKFGKSMIFMDVDNLLVGQRFDIELARALDDCDILIAIIGPRWTELMKARTATGERDYVREEIAEALKRRIAVVPVRVGREGSMPALPRPDELPADIRDLVLYQKHDVAHERFGRDMAELIGAIVALCKVTPGGRKPSAVARVPWGWVGATAASVLAVGYAGAYYAGVPVPRPVSNTEKRSDPFDQFAPLSKAPTQSGSASEIERLRAAATEEAARRVPQVGQAFRDCNDGCPEMVVVPAGSFTMGSGEDEEGHNQTEKPRRRVTIKKSFAAAKFQTTKLEFDAFIRATNRNVTGCWVWRNRWVLDRDLSFRNPGYSQDASHPVVCINWDDAKAYVNWLSERTGKSYRLLSEAEREYIARAGTSSSFWWGNTISTEQANYDGNVTYGAGQKGVSRRATVPVTSFMANSWGFYGVHGNVWEWVEDCWHESYLNAPNDGSAWITACSNKQRVVRGGSWNEGPAWIRSANRGQGDPGRATGSPFDGRASHVGVRVARDDF
jgi:formylglycine-generating enzyme required for sulfatase activity